MLRFELESALIAGTLDVAELPAAWNDGMRRLIGIEPLPDRFARCVQRLRLGMEAALQPRLAVHHRIAHGKILSQADH